MTRVCTRCGWLVFAGVRCSRCSGISINHEAAARVCGVKSLWELLHITPGMRIQNFHRARARYLTTKASGP